ncbi:phage minor capsid protein [Sporolactobacillus terrae]|uniref:phage minor capsid protein n=1 Tax=Sporolactobacillus terrae TaxID=269673 RepID=UPI0009DE59C0|nr:phage minor capsid protein [Sporolactobacillus terrae]
MSPDKLIDYFSFVVQDILSQVSSVDDLQNDANALDLINSILKTLDRLKATVADVIPEQILKEYFGGVDEGTKLLIAAGLEIKKASAMTKDGKVRKEFQSTMHLEAVQNIVEDTMMDLNAAIRTAQKSARASINGVLDAIKKDIANGLIVGDPRKVIQTRVAKSFADNGLTSFVTSDNKRLPLDFYSQTVVRTKMRTANTTGAVNRYLENGVTLVKVDEHQPTCHVCAGYGGKVFCPDGSDKRFPDGPLPPYHPNCRHTVAPFLDDFHTDDEIQAELNKWNNFKPDKDVRSAAQRYAYEHEQAIRRQANAEKKQYANYKMVLGKDAPKTIGAFRRMKRGNTSKFQALQKEYRSIMQTKSTVRIMPHVPGYDKAVFPDAKFEKYILNNAHPEGGPKAEAFDHVLGYNLTNKDELIQNIKDHLPTTKATFKGNNGYGDGYEAIMELTGPNGRTAPVLTAWFKDNEETRLVSAFIIDEKKSNRKRGK